jgi:hypothetical protein
MTESELNETLKILYRTDRYLFDCLCIHLINLDKKIEKLSKERDMHFEDRNLWIECSTQQNKEIKQFKKKYTNNIIGRLATLKHFSTIYVVWNYYESSGLYLLLELDSPQDGEQLLLKEDEFHLLEPLEVVEYVTEWI